MLLSLVMVSVNSCIIENMSIPLPNNSLAMCDLIDLSVFVTSERVARKKAGLDPEVILI